ncbi:hypothetical protein R3P38DRAFT_2590160, partial [Favolaschia claudopus]
VFPKSFMFSANDRQKTVYSQESFKPFGSIQHFFNFRPNGVPLTIGLAIVWKESFVKQDLQTWMDKFLHANVLVIIHPPPNTKGKHLLVFDPNISPHHTTLLPRMVNLIESSSTKFTSKWYNHPRQSTNSGGNCLQLAFEFILDVVIKGEDWLGVQRDEAGKLVGVKQFSQLDL